jgi:hypothetical protein
MVFFNFILNKISIHVQVTHARMKEPVPTFQMTMNVYAQVDGPVKAVKMVCL